LLISSPSARWNALSQSITDPMTFLRHPPPEVNAAAHRAGAITERNMVRM
jgi:p-aminobenzoyl-glutamate transporter AbgT